MANRGGPDNLSANYVCHNAGDATFAECTVLSRDSATTIAGGDLTGDGFTDLFVPHRDGGQSYLYVNDGAGGFAERHPVGPAESATRAVALGDVTADGLGDIVVGDQLAGGVWLHANRGGARFAAPRPIGDPSDVVYSLAVADIDGDGNGDIVVGNRGATNAVLINRGAGRRFATSRFGDAEGATYGLAVGDVNGDGHLDIVAGRSDASNTLYLGTGSPRATTTAAAPDNWPSWRGIDMDGMAAGAKIPVHFDENTNVRWKVEIPGRGLSTPIIWGDTIFLQAAVPVGEPLEPRTPLEDWQRDGTEIFDGLSYVAPDRDMRFVLFALDRADGSLRWQRVLRQEQPHEGIHPTNTWASASPVTDGERVIAYFGSRGLYALDLEGKLLWERDLGDMDTRKGWGEGSSAALPDGRVLVPWDHEGDSSAGVPRYPLVTYTRPSMLAIDLDRAHGEVEPGQGLAWRYDRDTPYLSSPLLIDDTIYFTKHLRGIISALDAADGSPILAPKDFRPSARSMPRRSRPRPGSSSPHGTATSWPWLRATTWRSTPTISWMTGSMPHRLSLGTSCTCEAPGSSTASRPTRPRFRARPDRTDRRLATPGVVIGTNADYALADGKRNAAKSKRLVPASGFSSRGRRPGAICCRARRRSWVDTSRRWAGSLATPPRCSRTASPRIPAPSRGPRPTRSVSALRFKKLPEPPRVLTPIITRAIFATRSDRDGYPGNATYLMTNNFRRK